MRRRVLLSVACVLALALTFGGGVALGRSRPSAPTSGGVVVGRIGEIDRGGDGHWAPFGAVVETGAVSLRSVEADGIRFRWRLTIRDTSASPPNYDVLVKDLCFDAVSVGDQWPVTVPACR